MSGSQSSSTSRPGPIVVLAYLRAWSAVVVVLFHQFQDKLNFTPDYNRIFVGVFFIISGFIVFGATESRRISISQFLLDRIVRIVPLYWLSLLISGLVGPLFAIPAPPMIANVAPAVPDHGGAHFTLIHGLETLFFIPSFNRKHEIFPIFLYGWTINYEMFFYALMTALLFIKKEWRIYILGSIVIALLVIGVSVPLRNAALIFYTSPPLTEFFAGVTLASVFGATLRKRSLTATLQGAGLVLAIMCVLAAVIPTAWVAFIYALVLVGLLFLERNVTIPQWKPAMFLAEASYSIYLMQFVPAAMVAFVAYHLGFRSSSSMMPNVWFRLIAFVWAVGCGCLLYLAVERPLLRWLKRTARRMAGLPPVRNDNVPPDERQTLAGEALPSGP